MVLTEEFKKNEKELVFFGVSHSTNKKQIEKIQKRIESYNPDVILIEGGFENATFSNEKEFVIQGGEMGFISYFAKKNNIQLEPNDPSERDCIKFIENNYGKDFAFLYFVLRNLDSFLRKQMPLSPEERLKITIEDFRKDSAWTNYDYSLSNFKEIFSKIFNGKFVLDDIYGNYFDPNRQNHPTNKATEMLSKFRDEFMLKQIKKCLSQKNKIFVVKGSSHLIKNKKLIKDLFNGSEF